MSQTTAAILDAIATSQRETRRVTVRAIDSTDAIGALHAVDDYGDRSDENDGSWDVWGGSEDDGTAWRLRIVFG